MDIMDISTSIIILTCNLNIILLPLTQREEAVENLKSLGCIRSFVKMSDFLTTALRKKNQLETSCPCFKIITHLWKLPAHDNLFQST